MNAVEIEEAVSELAESPFDADEFPFSFLAAFGNKETTIKKLRHGESNQSDLEGGILQRNNIHILVHSAQSVGTTLSILRESASTKKYKAKFILATDGQTIEAENVVDGETVVCSFHKLGDHFGFFLPLAGITTVKEIRENSFDIKATARLNRLYLELLKDNPKWEKAENKEKLNHFIARLIFCFFAEDTSIFQSRLFTEKVEQMSASDSSNTHEVIFEIFRSMCTHPDERNIAKVKNWASSFPYVNGGLFSGDLEVPRFSKIARSYLLHVGKLDWTKINPDIFGSMIQAVADDEERGSLGMHYTSVPNILKVLNPLFLDELRAQLEEAGTNSRKLLNLRRRISQIRVFDPACGSGNFLVIAYKQMRKIEAEINHRRNEVFAPTVLRLTNFRGIELRHFSAEIARLALTIAEYQCDELYRGAQLALAAFLPLKDDNWITSGNALRLDWFKVCPIASNSEPAEFSEKSQDILEANGDTYICGNPPYRGSQWQTPDQKVDLKTVFAEKTKNWGSLDYVAGWFLKAAEYASQSDSTAAFVATNSVCQGRQVATLWPIIFSYGCQITFAHTNFKWTNLASHNAGVTVSIIGISSQAKKSKLLYADNADSVCLVKETSNINPYLISGPTIIVETSPKPMSQVSPMSFGNMPNEGGHFLLNSTEAHEALKSHQIGNRFIKPFVGSQEFIRGNARYCIWIPDADLEAALSNSWLSKKIELVRQNRLESARPTTQALAKFAHRFGEVRQKGDEIVIAVAAISSENRDYLPCGLLPRGTIISNKCYALYDAPLWNMALIASRLHWVWIGTVCVRMRTDFSYSNTLGWNTFPVPTLTEKNKEDLTRCAENILLAREAHFPATIADLYDPETMPENLRAAHAQNDETLERIYVGRKFKNDTERLEKLFELYTKMTAQKPTPNVKTRGSKK